MWKGAKGNGENSESAIFDLANVFSFSTLRFFSLLTVMVVVVCAFD